MELFMLRIQRTRKEEKKVQRKYSICVNGREIVKTSTTKCTAKNCDNVDNDNGYSGR